MNALGKISQLVGYRNIAYVAFVGILIPLGMQFEALGSKRPHDEIGVYAAMLLWMTVSVAFIVANAVLMAVAMMKGRPVTKHIIACSLPSFCVLVEAVVLGLR